MNTHDAIINAYVSLGYSLDDGGCCHGAALRWLEASFLDEEPLFHKRLLKIVAYGQHLKAALEAVKAKRGKNLTKEDKFLLEIQAFMDHLHIFQAPFEQQSLFNTIHPVLQDDIDKASMLGSSEAIKRLGGLTSVYSQSLIYNELEIAQYLDHLGVALENHCLLPGKKVGILLSSYLHSIALTYTTGKGWRFMDINEYPPESLPKNETQKIAKKIVDSLKQHQSPYIAFTSKVITVKNDLFINSLTEGLSKLSATHPVTNNIAQREEQVNLCFLASMRGEAKIVDEAAKNGANVEFTDKNGMTPVMIATLQGHDAVINVLAKHNANLDVVDEESGRTPLHYAIADKYTKVITCLAQHQADLNARDRKMCTPLILAVSRGNVEAVAELIKFGADASQSIAYPLKKFNPTSALSNQRFNTLVKQKLVVNDEILITPQEIAYVEGNEPIVTLLKHASRINSLYQSVVALEKYCETSQTPQAVNAAYGLKEFTNEYISLLTSPQYFSRLGELDNRYTKGMQFLATQSQEPQYVALLNNIHLEFKSLASALRPLNDSPLKRKSLFASNVPKVGKRMKIAEDSVDESMRPDKGI
ncbi:ankyrin repeat domain-containing protein [Legionella saoudiensis]|uniref:ankyrin repeat domain-containing protein n=1 Tax=Legionella saoudiensis TaxID=1750561 RepID=UPI0007304FE2|nr:ankyrin repeat domain-containing protein [Legionella saoudiensis]